MILEASTIIKALKFRETQSFLKIRNFQICLAKFTEFGQTVSRSETKRVRVITSGPMAVPLGQRNWE